MSPLLTPELNFGPAALYGLVNLWICGSIWVGWWKTDQCTVVHVFIFRIQWLNW